MTAAAARPGYPPAVTAEPPEPQLPPGSRHALAVQRQGMFGCGLAAYTLVLFGMFVAGVIGLSVASYSLIAAGEKASPLELSYGGLTNAYYLDALRRAGLLGPEEFPDVYHAEAVDGSVACAARGGELLRLGPEGAFRMPLAGATVEAVEDGVWIRGEREVLCRFGPGEGADRFARMLQARPARPAPSGG